MNKKGIIKTILGLFAFTLVCALCARYAEKKYFGSREKKAEEVEQVSEESKIGLPDENGSYIGDVAYDGAEEVDKSVFMYPFAKTDDYVANKIVIKNRKKEYIENAKTFTEDFFAKAYGTGFHEVESDTKSYINDVLWYYLPNAYDWDNNLIDDVIAQKAEYIKENHIQAEIDVDTADYLVYEDGMTYVRGVVNVTSYQCDADSTEKDLGLELAKDGSYVFDLQLYPNGTYEGDAYFVISCNILGEV